MELNSFFSIVVNIDFEGLPPEGILGRLPGSFLNGGGKKTQPGSNKNDAGYKPYLKFRCFLSPGFSGYLS